MKRQPPGRAAVFFAVYFFGQDRDSEGVGLVQLAAGALTGQQVVRLLRHRPRDLSAVLLNERGGFAPLIGRERAGQDEGLAGKPVVHGRLLTLHVDAGRPEAFHQFTGLRLPEIVHDAVGHNAAKAFNFQEFVPSGFHNGVQGTEVLRQ